MKKKNNKKKLPNLNWKRKNKFDKKNQFKTQTNDRVIMKLAFFVVRPFLHLKFMADKITTHQHAIENIEFWLNIKIEKKKVFAKNGI